jgi:undecaprenyl-diphosphatase
LLALVQGVTEFLPISSSAHLILPSRLLGWADQGVIFDVAVHLGSLLAVLWYFRRELISLATGCLRALTERRINDEARMTWYLVVATLPVVAAGLLLIDLVAGQLRSIPVIACTTIGFGLLLALADRRRGGEGRMNLRTALWVGVAQVLAIVPGTSRSGITMTAGLFCGLDREQASRFSFLLSIPVILAASVLAGSEALEAGGSFDWQFALTGIAVSAVTAYATIALFLSWVQRIGFMPFVLYRCMLGAVLLLIWVQEF